MRTLFFFTLLALLASCSNNSSEPVEATYDTTFITEQRETPSIEAPVTFRNLIWSPVYDSVKGAISVKRQRTVNPDTLTASKLISEINNSWEGITLAFRKISNDTIYVAIPESTVLTQQMGSSGALGYMSSTTYTLTELKNIKFVNYNFTEGDHMAPGTMKRADFKQ